MKLPLRIYRKIMTKLKITSQYEAHGKFLVKFVFFEWLIWTDHISKQKTEQYRGKSKDDLSNLYKC